MKYGELTPSHGPSPVLLVKKRMDGPASSRVRSRSRLCSVSVSSTARTSRSAGSSCRWFWRGQVGQPDDQALAVAEQEADRLTPLVDHGHHQVGVRHQGVELVLLVDQGVGHGAGRAEQPVELVVPGRHDPGDVGHPVQGCADVVGRGAQVGAQGVDGLVQEREVELRDLVGRLSQKRSMV